eukprot:12824343-Alexandrium_andersonii.AAC.1
MGVSHPGACARHAEAKAPVLGHVGLRRRLSFQSPPPRRGGGDTSAIGLRIQRKPSRAHLSCERANCRVRVQHETA